MDREALEKLYITNEHGTFSPIYTENKGIYTIVKTAEEVYQDYLSPPTPEPTKEELLQKQLLETQALVANLQEQILLNK